MDQAPLLSAAEPSLTGGGEGPAAAAGGRPSSSLNAVFESLEKDVANGDASHESLDYDGVHNSSFLQEGKAFEATGEKRRCWGYSGATLGRWILTVFIGLAMGLVAFFLSATIETVTLKKIDYVETFLNPCICHGKDCVLQDSCAAQYDAAGSLPEPQAAEERAKIMKSHLNPWGALAVFAGINALLALGGAIPTVFLAPEAAGSGIPEVMGYLNGVHVPKIMRLRTLVIKLFGTFCAVASGLAVGPEGPLVHTGAIMGSGVTRGFKVWRWRERRLCSCRCKLLERFHNDTDRRDFISMGAAVGFAAAFGAPIGGVLFALEEAASFWNTKLMWRTLSATTCACFIIALSKKFLEPEVFGERESCAFQNVRTCVYDHGADGKQTNTTCATVGHQAATDTLQPGLLTFAGTAYFSNSFEYVLCAVVGVIGGVLGALFNHLHAKMTKLRKRYCSGLDVPWRKFRMLADVLALSLVTSVLMFWLSTSLGHCRPLNPKHTPEADKCSVNVDDFRLQWGSSTSTPLPPPPTCNVTCAQLQYPNEPQFAPCYEYQRRWECHVPGIDAICRDLQTQCRQAEQSVCPIPGNVNSGSHCPKDRPLLDILTNGCFADETRMPDWKNLAAHGECCNTSFGLTPDGSACAYVDPNAVTGDTMYQCSDKEYNDMATALLISREHVIVSIMVDPARYSKTALFCVGCSFFVLMILTYGSAIPAGLFIPTIMVGTCFGALFGIALEIFFGAHCNPGPGIPGKCTTDLLSGMAMVQASPYALIGAVALLGGVQRSSLSLVVIIVEGTGAVTQLMPIILTTVVSKWVGDAFNHGLYHTALELKKIPFLETEERRKNRHKTAQDVMTPAGRRGDGLVTLEERETVQSVLKKLVDNSHNGFPVLRRQPDERQVFVGLVLRNQIYTLIADRHFVRGSGALRESVREESQGQRSPDRQRTREKLYEVIVQRQGSAGHRSKVPWLIGAMREQEEAVGDALGEEELDLKQVMNESPFTVDAHCPLQRVWRLFRSMGLRHLVVLDHDHCVVGIITRADLLEAAHESSPRQMRESRRLTAQQPRVRGAGAGPGRGGGGGGGTGGSE